MKPRFEVPSPRLDFEEFDDVIELECRTLKEYITYTGTKLGDIVKVRVNCHCDTKINKESSAQRYEDLWYQRSQSIGQRKFNTLPVRECDQVAIIVKEDPLHALTGNEAAACAAALVLMRLELTVNRNLIAKVRVPNNSLDNLVSELRKQNFYPYAEISEQIDTMIPIQLETDSGKREVLCFKSTRQ